MPSSHVYSTEEKDISISDHALERWNDRVGPIAATKGELEEHLSCYWRNFNRFRIFGRGCIIFDKDILAGGCEIDSTHGIRIATFFGRISLTSNLANANHLFHFVRRQSRGTGYLPHFGYIRDEGICLDVPKEILETQKWPWPNVKKPPRTEPRVNKSGYHTVLFEISHVSEQSFLVIPLLDELNESVFDVNMRTIRVDLRSMKDFCQDFINGQYYNTIYDTIRQMFHGTKPSHLFLKIRTPASYSTHNSRPTSV